MIASYEKLARNIWVKCEEEHWFGGELINDLRPEDDPQRRTFDFPRVSEEQIKDAERHLGFPLPPFLRYIYTHIANGGFGPGLGLHGIMNGFGSDCDYNNRLDRSIVGWYRFKTRGQAINLDEYPPEIVYEGTEQKFWRFPLGTWPHSVLPLSDMGCAQTACVSKESQMFLNVAIEQHDMCGLVQLGWTFEEWIERWLNGVSTTW